MSTTLLVLSLNEIEGMKAIMPTIDKAWVDDILIIDGGSTDGTIEWAKENGYRIIVQKNPGLGAAYMEGLENAVGDVIVTFSPDGNSVAEYLPKLLSKLELGYDIVSVSRYLEWAKSDDDDFITRIGNWIFTALFNILFHQKTTDYLVMYRAFHKELAQELGINHQSISWQSQLMCRAAKANKKIGEIPGDEPARIGGVRKMKPIHNGLAELRMLASERT